MTETDSIISAESEAVEQHDSLLIQSGSDRERMLSATVYVRDMKDFAAMNESWDSWVPSALY